MPFDRQQLLCFAKKKKKKKKVKKLKRKLLAISWWVTEPQGKINLRQSRIDVFYTLFLYKSASSGLM
jgi:hypothetical protein